MIVSAKPDHMTDKIAQARVPWPCRRVFTPDESKKGST